MRRTTHRGGGGARLRALAPLAIWALGVAPALATVGIVVDEQGQALEGVSACYVVNGTEVMCVSTNKQGLFDLPESKVGKIRLTLPDYLPTLIDAVPEGKPIVLSRAAEIWVRLVGPTQGEVFLIFPSGERKGPFPVRNENGVRVRTLAPGRYRVVARADGWVQTRGHEVELVGGVVADARVELSPDEPSDE